MDADRSRSGHALPSTPAVETGGIDVFDSFFVRQAVRSGATTEVLDLLSGWAAANDDGTVRTLVPVDGVTLVTLFLDDGDSGFGGAGASTDDALVWYVEVADGTADAWSDPDETLREASPLFEAGLGTLLQEGADVFSNTDRNFQLATHAANPHRQRRYEETCGDPLVAPVTGERLPIEVVVTTVRLKPGWVSRLVGYAVRVSNALKQFDPVDELLRDQTETLEREGMYTESLLFESTGDRRVLHYYMETEDMAQLYEGYGASDRLEVRFSDWVMRRIFADPAEFLEPPLESDCEVLIHAVHPERP
jgi:hypothetical protein